MSDQERKWWEPDPEYERRQKRMQIVFAVIAIPLFLLWLFHQ
jgi:hypothetical protein